MIMPRRTKVQVLLVEDHALLRAGVKSLLNAEGDIDVVGECGTAEEAVTMAVEMQPDLALVDLNMPGRGGLYAISEIRRRCPETQVLVVTMHTSDEYIQESLRSGAAGYLLKDASHQEMINAIRTVLAGKTYLSPDVSARVVTTLLSGDKSAAPAGAGGRAGTLSTREREVLKLVAEGQSNRQVAETLHLSTKTVEKHRASLMQKLGLRNTAALTAYAVRNGVVGP